jgi:hypothetical protein
VGLLSVKFFANGKSVDNDAGAPFTATWETGPFDDGSVKVRAVARYQDPGFRTFEVWSDPVTAMVTH